MNQKSRRYFNEIAIAIPLGIAVYFIVERRGIEIGRRLAARLPGGKPPAQPAPPAVSFG